MGGVGRGHSQAGAWLWELREVGNWQGTAVSGSCTTGAVGGQGRGGDGGGVLGTSRERRSDFHHQRLGSRCSVMQSPSPGRTCVGSRKQQGLPSQSEGLSLGCLLLGPLPAAPEPVSCQTGLTVSATQDSGQEPIIHGSGQPSAGHRVSVWEKSPFGEFLDTCPVGGGVSAIGEQVSGVRQRQRQKTKSPGKCGGVGVTRKGGGLGGDAEASRAQVMSWRVSEGLAREESTGTGGPGSPAGEESAG